MGAFSKYPAQQTRPLRQTVSADELPVERYYQKIALYPLNPDDLVVAIRDPRNLLDAERSRLLERISQTNFVVYQYDESNPDFQHGYRRICNQLGLHHSLANPASNTNNVTTIEVMKDQTHLAARYIPFSNHALKWHTDGYYNPQADTVRSFVLHCCQPADSGGETCLLDHELVYALLHRQNPRWISALSDAHTMTIPANIQDGKTIRAAYRGPVFSPDSDTGQLQMRYTERSRNIEWRADADTAAALAAIREILSDEYQKEKHWTTRLTLQPGQGVIANNVLHNRSAFSDSVDARVKHRTLQRIRFADRVGLESEISASLR